MLRIAVIIVLIIMLIDMITAPYGIDRISAAVSVVVFAAVFRLLEIL